MAGYELRGYGCYLSKDICNEFGIDSTFRKHNDPLERFINEISEFIPYNSLFSSFSEGKDGGLSDFYYFAPKETLESDSDVVVKYQDSLKNIDQEFEDIFMEIDELPSDYEGEFIKNIFNSSSIEEAKSKILKLKDIVLRQYPEFITVTMCDW